MKRLINTSVATVWTHFDSARDIDKEAIGGNPDITKWINGLSYEKSLDLCNSNLVQTQVLFGEEVLVIEEKEGWAHVICHSQPSSKDTRGYPGWIPSAQLADSNGFNLEGEIAVVTSKKAELVLDGEAALVLCFQTILPVLSQEEDRIKVQTPEGYGWLSRRDAEIYPNPASIPKGNGAGIAAAGEQFVGLPYLWGGVSSFGYDCSGFSYTMAKANGYRISRDAHDQLEDGRAVELDQLQPGDLLYFAYEEGKGAVHHVGIYYGDGKLLHSPKTGKSIEIIPLEGTLYKIELCAARRYGA